MHSLKQKAANSDIDKESTIPDFLALILIPVLLTAIHYLSSPSVKDSLAYNPLNPELITLISSSAVHGSVSHLSGNLVAYGLIALTAYAIAIWIVELRWFRLSVLTILITTPIITHLAIPQFLLYSFGAIPESIRGFSSIVAGLGGMTLILYLGLLRRFYDGRAALTGGGVLTIVFLSQVALTYGALSEKQIAAVAIGMLLIVAIEIGDRVRSLEVSSIRFQVLGETLFLGGMVLLYLGLLVYGLFPEDPYSGGSSTAIFSHALGFLIGMLTTFWGHRYWTPLDWW